MCLAFRLMLKVCFFFYAARSDMFVLSFGKALCEFLIVDLVKEGETPFSSASYLSTIRDSIGYEPFYQVEYQENDNGFWCQLWHVSPLQWSVDSMLGLNTLQLQLWFFFSKMCFFRLVVFMVFLSFFYRLIGMFSGMFWSYPTSSGSCIAVEYEY